MNVFSCIYLILNLLKNKNNVLCTPAPTNDGVLQALLHFKNVKIVKEPIFIRSNLFNPRPVYII